MIGRLRQAWLPVAATLALTVQFGGIMLLLDDASEPACASTGRPPQALRVLLVSADGREPGYAAWNRRLTMDGVPFDSFVATRQAPLRRSVLVDRRGRPRYHAVILATDALLSFRDGRARTVVSAAERRVLEAFERRYHIREIVAEGDPATRGLRVPPDYGKLGGEGRLTTRGRAAFPALKGPVPLTDVLARPAEARRGARPLLVDAKGRALLAVVRDGGRERLISVMQLPSTTIGFLALAPEMLRWATRGVHVGASRPYLAVHVDDVLLPNFRWDMQANRTVRRRPIRMTGADALATVKWMRAEGVRIDMVFNGAGAEQRRPLGCERPSDDLTLELLEHRDATLWMNHTYSHLDLDDVPLEQLVSEIEQNERWARDSGLPTTDGELVTGEHSGLRNPAMAQALERTGIAWIASDASREPEQRRLGPALTVPRWAPNLYYDVGTRAEQVDQYNHRYAETCERDCRPRVDWPGYLRIEGERLLQLLLDNDPRPLYVHQSNLAEDRTLLDLTGELVRQARRIDDRPLIQPTLAEAGEELRRRTAWAAAWRRGAVRVTRERDGVVVDSRIDVHVPLTGARGTDRSGWVRVRAGERRTLPLAAG